MWRCCRHDKVLKKPQNTFIGALLFKVVRGSPLFVVSYAGAYAPRQCHGGACAQVTQVRRYANLAMGIPPPGLEPGWLG